MTKRALIVASGIGLVAACVATLLLNRAALIQSIDLLILALNVVAAGIAGRVLLGRARVHRYIALGVVLLSAIAAAIFTTAVTGYLINIEVTYGRANYVPATTIVVTALIGIAVYLTAAILYSFATTIQGVSVRQRLGLLALLLLAAIPALNVLGLIGTTISAFVRGRPATPAPLATSG